jgi:hypothetical protein
MPLRDESPPAVQVTSEKSGYRSHGNVSLPVTVAMALRSQVIFTLR